MKYNKIIAAGMAAALTIVTVMPAYAAITRTEPGTGVDDRTFIYTDNSDNINYPCWIWVDGYCYYYQNAGTILKNTTTPDGYTVDSEGRWALNGIVQTNGYGNYSMGTADYTGKSDDEIWELMKQKLEPVFVNGVPLGDGATAWTAKDSIAFDIAYGAVAGNEITVNHNFESYGTFVTAHIGTAWSDQINDIYDAVSKVVYSNESEIKEKTIKTIVGDQIGQELFTYIRTHADKKSSGYIMAIDENGNPIRGYWTVDPSTISADLPFGDPNAPDVWIDDPNGSGYKTIRSESCGDGIHASTLDFSAWQNRTTDYGKRFSVNANADGIRIDVYND